MRRQSKRTQFLLGLAVLAWLLFSYPLMAVFSIDAALAGIPVFYLYIFGAWFLVAGLTWLVVSRFR